MSKPELSSDLIALNARLRADPTLTEGMGPVHMLSVPGRVSGQLRSTPVSPVQLDGRRWIVAAICVGLAAIVWIVFGQTSHFEFINFDDGPYVVKNPVVNRGLTSEGFIWAFTHFHSGNWHPLTWLSHMLDCQLYGLDPRYRVKDLGFRPAQTCPPK